MSVEIKTIDESVALGLISCTAICFECGKETVYDDVASFFKQVDVDWFVSLEKRNGHDEKRNGYELLCASCYRKEQDEAVDWANG